MAATTLSSMLGSGKSIAKPLTGKMERHSVSVANNAIILFFTDNLLAYLI